MSVAKAQLLSIIERVERLEEEKAAIAADIKDVFLEAKGNGFDVKALKAILKLRKQDRDERAEHEAIVETYMEALGMLADTPLGQASLDSVMKRAKKESRRHTSEWTKNAADIAQGAADAGLISPEAAEEQKQMAAAIDKKFGESSEERVARAARNPDIRRAFRRMGTPVELTDEERAKGMSAAFIDKHGTRCSFGPGRV